MNCYRCATPIPSNARYCFACGADVSGDTAQGIHPIQRDPELEAKLAEELQGDFVIERLLGRGGMAVVFLARDLQLDRKVAIKVLPPELTYGQGLIERFKREARTAATLDHPHIVPIYRIAKSGKLFWFAMKFIVGESLADILEREKTLPPDRTAAILTQVADALEFAHQHSVIHRDVKPANVMLDRRGWATVTDFGIAKAVGLQSLTSSESMIGTPYYMSPEQCAGKQSLTGASDQYALGVMTYQILSGKLPFTGFATVDIIKQHCFDPPPPLGALRPGLPRELVKVVERALAKNPEDRFPSVTEYAAAFAAAAHDSGAVAPHPGPKAAASAPTGTASGAHRPRRLVLLGTVGGLTTVALISIVLWELRANQSTPDQRPLVTSRHPDSAAPPMRIADTDSVAARAAAAPVVRPAPPSPIGAAPAESNSTLKRAPPPSRRPAPREARLFLRGVSEDATVKLDGQQVHDSVLLLRPGRHEVAVTRPGFAPWTEILWADAGDQLARWVVAGPVRPPAPVPVPESTPRIAVHQPDATLRIQVQPPARIVIDNVDFGEQRTLVHSVAADASHRISIVPVRPGYARKDTILTPRPGDTLTVRIRLEAGP